MNYEDQLAETIARNIMEYGLSATNDLDELSECIVRALVGSGIDKRMSDQYNAVNDYKGKILKDYGDPINRLREITPNGVYTKNKHGDYVGLNVMLKRFIAEACESVRLKKD